MIEVKTGSTGLGRTIYDDGIARAAELGDGSFLLECAGRHVECDPLDLVDAMMALTLRVGGRLSLTEAVRATLEDIEANLTAEAPND